MIFWSSEKGQKDIATGEWDCPMCGKKARFKVFVEKTTNWLYFIPLPRKKPRYFATCGNCFNTIELHQEVGAEIVARHGQDNG